jgi:cytoskeletal protein CcmA (bactofilin family)
VIAEGLKIVGSVTAEGLVEVNGQIEGDMRCTSLIVSPQAFVSGGIQAERVVINGRVEGPIHGGEVILKSRAHVVGDIQHKSLAIERGAYFEGRSVQTTAPNGDQPEVVGMRLRREVKNGRDTVSAT